LTRRGSRRRNKPPLSPLKAVAKAAGSRRPFDIGDAKQRIYAALQTINCCHANKSIVLVFGIHRLFLDHEAELFRVIKKRTKMSKTAAIGLVPSGTLFGRLLATIDRLLMQSAQIAIRNGDLPRFGI
jgi:hypothetical protein